MLIQAVPSLPSSPDHQRIALHIAELEARSETLNSSFMTEISDPQRRNIQRELFALQTALDHYNAALDLQRGGAAAAAPPR